MKVHRDEPNTPLSSPTDWPKPQRKEVFREPFWPSVLRQTVGMSLFLIVLCFGGELLFLDRPFFQSYKLTWLAFVFGSQFLVAVLIWLTHPVKITRDGVRGDDLKRVGWNEISNVEQKKGSVCVEAKDCSFTTLPLELLDDPTFYRAVVFHTPPDHPLRVFFENYLQKR